MDRGWLLCDTAGVVGWFCSPSTGSPFGHHPRLRMVCPLWGQWMGTWRRFACLCSCISCIVCRYIHHLSSSAASTQRHSCLRQRRIAGIEHPHKSTLASGGGVPCLTAGDARRVNPWRRRERNLRCRQRRTASVEGVHPLSLPRKTQLLLSHIVTLISFMISDTYTHSVTT